MSSTSFLLCRGTSRPVGSQDVRRDGTAQANTGSATENSLIAPRKVPNELVHQSCTTSLLDLLSSNISVGVSNDASSDIVEDDLAIEDDNA